MKIAMMQPTFLPWMGYFELMLNADKFIILDDFQFVYRSYHRRNRLLLRDNTVKMFTLPIERKANDKKPINEVSIQENNEWRRKFWITLEENYCRTGFFEEYAPIFYPILAEPQHILSRQNISFIKTVAKLMEIGAEILYSSQMSAKGTRSEKNQRLLEEAGADIYLCAHGSFDYMREDGLFPLPHIETWFQNAAPQAYEQYGNTGREKFIPYISILDALFNIGAERTAELARSMTRHWLSWDEMAADLENKKSNDAA